MRKFKVIIVSNPLNHEGGVVNYYNLLFNSFESDSFQLEHFSIGSRAWLFYYPFLKKFLYPFYLILDILRFTAKLIVDRNIKIVQLSPSLIPVPLLRDGCLVLISKLFRKRVIVFFRGWKLSMLNTLREKNIIRTLFNFVYQKDTKQIVLAEQFKLDLMGLGHSTNSIDVTTTAIEKKNILDKKNSENQNAVNVLFLARIQDLKGIFELMEAIVLLEKEKVLQNYQFTIAGHEAQTGIIEKCKSILINNNVDLSFVKFIGRIEGKEKFKLYSENDIYILPSYTEGCPNSVLEALASGLYCITTNVGALNDIIKENVNGAIVEIKSSNSIKIKLNDYFNHHFNNEFKVDANHYKEIFDINNQVFLFQRIYTQLLNEK